MDGPLEVNPARGAAPALPAPLAARSVFTPRFLRILIAQTTFSFGWSLYLLAPKYFAVELGADARTVGNLSAIGGLFSVAIIPFAARGIDRIGRKPFFVAGCAAQLIVSLGFLLVHDLGVVMYGLNGLIGAAFVLAFNAGATLATDEVAPEKLGQAIGIFGASNMIMNGVSTLVGEKGAAAYGWPVVFMLGIASALAAAVLCLGSRNAASHHTSSAAAPVVAVGLRVLGPVLLSTALFGGTFCAMFVFSQPYALSRGAHEVNDFFIGFTAMAVLMRGFFGHVGDRFGRLRVSICAAVVYILAAASMTRLDAHMLLFHGAFFGFAHGVLYPTLNAVLMERVGLAQRGRAMTLYTGAFNVGTSLTGVAWGRVAAAVGYPAVYVGAALLSAAGVGLLVREARAGSRVEH